MLKCFLALGNNYSHSKKKLLKKNINVIIVMFEFIIIIIKFQKVLVTFKCSIMHISYKRKLCGL